MSTPKEKPPSSLSVALEELESIAANFEKGEYSLEQGLAEFKRGKFLAHHLKESLKKIENEITETKDL